MQERELERRQAARYALQLPVAFGAGTGTTRDVSVSGVFFDTDATVAVGHAVRVALKNIRTDPDGIEVVCEGRIVRVEPNDRRLGVAVFVETITSGLASLPRTRPTTSRADATEPTWIQRTSTLERPARLQPRHAPVEARITLLGLTADFLEPLMQGDVALGNDAHVITHALGHHIEMPPRALSLEAHLFP